MKTASVKELKEELKFRSDEDLIKIVLRLSRFKKENKELLTYLLFESTDEDDYIAKVKALMDNQFLALNTANNYRLQKGVRKVLRETKKYARYSGNKETEVALLIHFCRLMRETHPQVLRSKTMRDLMARQIVLIKTRISTLHEDLQYDFESELNMVEV
ncbi:hypothetical protein LX97_03303 [Nonlabens dokdonensis]|jgi:hypothetical protein|uniref:Uncharacterized protein n=2 Tax=Nonlabens dokdonensis TaxID=328515 RepID=L7W9Y7_NONDD|nr:hypothetical protein [Nonlabens dokdonensis]AGC76934.1 hypothetical protein DDD_1807 [Nonlabens dokdonensis DSW-6]PZX36840.1 hypothetical protein LX97_03303 [Nonlabens dokdonensis]